MVEPATPQAPAARRLSAIIASAIFLAMTAPGDALAQSSHRDAPAAQRVITLAPHATEMVYAAGGGDQLVGTVSSSDYPPAARDLTRVGDGIIVNQERIIMLQPTLMLGWLRSGVALQLESLAEHLGAQMQYLRPLTLRDIPAEILRTGTLLGTERQAGQAADALNARISALETRYSGLEPVTVFIEVGSQPLYTIGSDPLLNDALRLCGAINIYGDTGIPAPRVPVESVLVQNPQLVISSARPGTDAREVHKRWATYGLDAARKGRIHIADPDALYRPGPRLIDATEALCTAVHATRKQIQQTG